MTPCSLAGGHEPFKKHIASNGYSADGDNIDVEYIHGFVGWGGLQTKSMTSQRNRAVKDGGYVLLWQRYDNNKMADMCYNGNVMTTRWRVCVTMATL